MRPELLVNSHINGTAIYVYASMVGSHDLIPFSPVRTTIPQVFLNRVSHHNWKTWLEESLTRFLLISIHCQRYLHQSIKHVQKIFTKEKLKHHYEKWFRNTNYTLWWKPMKAKFKLHERSYWEKHYPISKQVFYDKTVEKLTTPSCFD